MNGEKHHRVLEFTSSGLTHAWAGPLNWPKPMPAPLLFRSFYYLWAMIGIHPWRVHAYPGLNFGEIEMSDDKHVIMRAIGVDNKTKFEIADHHKLCNYPRYFFRLISNIKFGALETAEEQMKLQK